MAAKGKEPTKYERNEKGNWVLSREWKAWNKKRREESKPKLRSKPKPKETVHVTIWKEVSHDPTSGKKIFFCVCRATQGDPFKGCGAVGIQQNRNAQIVEMMKGKDIDG